jgi:V/A-type H+-transporting ATPase subunit E
VTSNRGSRRNNATEVASGVEALIGRLREEGVANGRSQAEQIVSEAKAQAESKLKNAQEQADQIVSKAREEAENLKRAAHEALEVAFRDTSLALKTQLNQRFTGEVQRLVGAETQKPEILQKLILEVVGKVKEDVAEAQQVEVLLPRKVAGIEELSRNPEELEQGILTYFIRLVNRDLLREGVSFGVAKDNQGGLKLRLVDQEVVLDLSDRAIADAILEHLQPRFRALLEGMVK